jgi:hypothetical protein
MRRSLIALGLLCAVPHVAAAQRPGSVELVPPPAHERWFISIGATKTLFRTDRFSNQFAAPNEFLASARDVVAAEYASFKAFGMDVGIGAMLTPRLGIGVTRSTIKDGEVRMQTRTVRPQLFRRGTLIYQDGIFTSFDQTTTYRKERAYHVELSGVLLRARGNIIRVFAGPSHCQITQGLARRISLASAFVNEENGNDGRGWGYNAGLDAALYAPTSSKASGIGVGTSIRYSRATAASINGLDPAGGPQDYDVGGWHVTVGMRARF